MVEVLTAARQGTGISQVKLGKQLGLHRSAYGKIERGERIIDVVEFVAVVKALGKDPLELLGTYLVALQKDRLS